MNKFFGIFILVIFSLSCSSDLNFNQVNDIKLKPAGSANLSTFTVQAHEFVEDDVERPVLGEIISFEMFKESLFTNSLTRVDFFVEIDNTINRSYIVSLNFFDTNKTPIYTIPINVPAYGGSPNVVEKTEIIENTDLEILKSATYFAFIIKMLPGPMLSESSIGSLKLRSSATSYLEIE